MPSFTAFAVVGLLEQYFGNLVDYGFTAAMEDDLDEIAQGAREALPWLTHFYFGDRRRDRRTATGPPADQRGRATDHGVANGNGAGQRQRSRARPESRCRHPPRARSTPAR